jgi:hypothetical protein
MKKLLILMLVLGLATAANAAALRLTYNGIDSNTAPASVLGTTITVDMRCDSALSGISKVDFSEGTSTGTLSLGDWQVATQNQTTPPEDGTLSGNDIIDAFASKSGADWAADSILYSFDYAVDAANGGGTVVMLMSAAASDRAVRGLTTYWYGTTLDLEPLTILPEPMTIALLGLGGLFLRRRR